MDENEKVLTYPRLSLFLSEIKKIFASTNVATTSKNGLMSSAMFTKLNGIATGANKYTHPTTSGNKHIPAGGKSGQILKWSSDGTGVWGDESEQTLSSLGITATAAELNKLDGCTATVAELNYVDGVTSNIQTQLNGKAAKVHSHILMQKTEPTNQNIGDIWLGEE